MSSQIVPFEFGAHQVRVIQAHGEPWFVLTDLCVVLGLSSPHKVAERIDMDARSLAPVIDSMGRQQNVTVVSESGMYQVVLRSDKPEAAAFRRWITNEVIPQIRKTGSYSAPKTLAERSLELLGELTSEVQRQAAQIAELAPRAAVADAFEQDHGLKLRVFIRKYFPDEKEKSIMDFLYHVKMLLIHDPQGRWSDVQQKRIPGPNHQHPYKAGREFFHLAEEPDNNGKLRLKLRVRRDREHHLVGYLARHGFKTTHDSLPTFDLGEVA